MKADLFIFVFIIFTNFVHGIKFVDIFERVDGNYCAASKSIELVIGEALVKTFKHWKDKNI